MFVRMHWVTLLLICLSGRLICPGGASTGKKCSFPAEWRGRYYQTGLGDVVIRDNFITTKGTCVEQNNRDYFLFHNRESQCYHCLLILRQHRNIIQYKESYCTSVANMTVVCNQIRVETTLYTMVKEPTASGVRCPFHDAFNFTYNDMTSDFCAKMESYAKPCVSETRYQLLFRHCTGSALYNDKEFHLECLATWKDGSEMYLYGKLNGPGLISKDDRYRCFKYQNYGSEVSLAMSADTSCRGLRSASDGPFLMKFSKDSLRSRPTSTCQYPDWLRGVTWRSLDGKSQYTLDDKSEILSEYFRSPGGHLQRINEFRCNDNFNAVASHDEVSLVSFTSHKCTSKHQCIRLKRMGSQVIEFFQGPWVEIPGTYERCLTHSYENGHLLISDDDQTVSPCPRPGIYYVSASAGPETCERRIEVGCQSSSVTEVHDRCEGTLTVATLECLWSWNQDSKTILIARSKSAGTINCFSFRRDVMSQSDYFGLDFSCTGNQTASWEGWESPFKLHKDEPCANVDKSTVTNIDYQPAITDRLPVPRPSPTRSPEQELNLYADGVQPRRRSKLPPLFNEEDDNDEIYSGNEEDEEEEEEEEEEEQEGTLYRNTQRAPLDRYPVTRRRVFAVSTPPTVFQISSSPRRGNSAKHGPKSVSSNRERIGNEEQEGRSGQGKVNTFDLENSCGRMHWMQYASLVPFILFTRLLLCCE